MNFHKDNSQVYLISVVIPVYNAEKDLFQCLDSLANQDDDHFEVVMVDDGSTDGSMKVIDSFKNRIPNLKTVRQANSGSGGARNNGIINARGEFILFVDSDDYVTADYISILRKKQLSGNFNMVCGRYKLVDENGLVMRDPMRSPPQFNPPLTLDEEILGTYERCVPWGKLFRKDDYLKANVKFPRKIPHEDWFFTYKLARKLKNIGFVDEEIYYWRQREGSTSKSMSTTHIDILPFLRNDTYLYLKQNHGSKREFALASRRNLIVTNNFRNRIRKSGETNFDYYAGLICDTEHQILADLINYESSEFHEPVLSKAIRIIIEECKKLSSDITAPVAIDAKKTVSNVQSTYSPAQYEREKIVGNEVGSKLSLITPSYNQARFVGKMIDSIKQQSVLPFEHIILDAGSNDGTLEILEDYKKQNSFVKLHIGRDNGQTNAINLGFLDANGDIIAWLNTDDQYYSNTVIEKILKTFEMYPEVDVIYGRGIFNDADGKFIREAYLNKEPDKLVQKFINSVGILQPALFMRKEVFDKIGPLNERYGLCFDYEYWIRIANAGLKFYFLDEILCEAILHQDSKTVGQRTRQLTETAYAVKEHYGFVPAEWIHKLVDSELTGADGITTTSPNKSEKHAEAVHKYFLEFNDNSNSIAAILSLGHHPEVEKTLRMLNHLTGSYKIYLATAFDSKCFHEGLTLIRHVQLHSSFKYAFLIYDLGMTPDELKIIKDISDVFILNIPKDDELYPSDYFTTKTFGFKFYLSWHASKILPEGSIFIFLDAGIAPVSDFKQLPEIVSDKEILLIDQFDYSQNETSVIVSHINDDCILSTKANSKELASPLINGGLFGYKIAGKYSKLFEDSYRYSLTPGILQGDRFTDKLLLPDPSFQAKRDSIKNNADDANNSSSTELRKIFGFFGHRHDQSIMSVLAARFKAPIFQSELICVSSLESDEAFRQRYRAGHEKHVSDFVLDSQLIGSGAMCVQHQGLYVNNHGLRFNFNTKSRAVILGNGPSLRGFSFERLKGFDVFGMNAAYRYWDRIGWYPQFYSCLDTLVGDSHAHEIKRLIENAHEYGIKKFLLLDSLIQKLEISKNKDRIINFDALKRGSELLSAPSLTTGSHTAAWAAYLGYKEIYLMGIDSNYVEVIEGAKVLEGRVVQMEVTPERNPNYFFDDYQQKGDISLTPNPDRPLHLQSWREIAGRIKNTGSQIYNANLISRVDAFDFCHFPEIEEGKLSTLLPREHVLLNSFIQKTLSGFSKKRNSVRKPVLLCAGNIDGLNLRPYLDDGWSILCVSDDQNQINLFKYRYEVESVEKVIPDDSTFGPEFLTIMDGCDLYRINIPGEEATTINDAIESKSLNSYYDFITYLYVSDLNFLKKSLPLLEGSKVRIDALGVNIDFAAKHVIHETVKEISGMLKNAGYNIYHAIWHTVETDGKYPEESFSFHRRSPSELPERITRYIIYATLNALDEAILHHQLEDLDYNQLYRMQKFGFTFDNFFKTGAVTEDNSVFALSSPSSRNYIAYRYNGRVKPDDLITGKVSLVSSSAASIRLMLCRDGSTPFEFGEKNIQIEPGAHTFEVQNRFMLNHSGVRIQFGVQSGNPKISKIETRLEVQRNGLKVDVRGVQDRVVKSGIKPLISEVHEPISFFKKSGFYINKMFRRFYSTMLEFLLPHNTKGRLWAGMLKKHVVLFFQKIGL